MAEFNSLSILFWSLTLVLPGSFGYRTFLNETIRIGEHHNNSGSNDSHFTYFYDQEAIKARIPEYPIHPMILGRRSINIGTGEPLTDEELYPLFEAFKWGPSAFNNQPWRIVYSHRGTPRYQQFLNSMLPKNREWAQTSSVLMVVIANMFSVFEGNELYMIGEPTTTGLAFSALSLEATARGLMVRPIHGFDKSFVAKILGIDKDHHFQVIMMLVVGKPKPNANPKVSPRRPLAQFISMDHFKSTWIY